MVVIKEVSAKSVLDSRNEKTIEVSVKTSIGKRFSASAPNGKSKGKNESKPYKKSLNEDIEKINEFKDYFSEEDIENFLDLRLIEDVIEGHVGANTCFAIESAVLKALAQDKCKEVWQIVNPKLKKKSLKFPRLVGNCIGGGKHSSKFTSFRNPDFQEFLLIPDTNSISKSFQTNKKLKEYSGDALKKNDENFENKKNDENAWVTSFDDKKVFDVLKNCISSYSKNNSIKVDIGTDVAASSFYKRKKYDSQNPPLKRNVDEHFNYLSNLIKNFNLFYVEDPFDEEDFEKHSELLAKFKNCLIVGDDLTVTNIERLKNAIEKKAINAIIVKPNQNGSLLEVKKVCELAKKNKIKLVFSHRSGETNEDILSDLALGFQSDFFKCGITGKERESKITRLIEIEKSLK